MQGIDGDPERGMPDGSEQAQRGATIRDAHPRHEFEVDGQSVRRRSFTQPRGPLDQPLLLGIVRRGEDVAGPHRCSRFEKRIECRNVRLRHETRAARIERAQSASGERAHRVAAQGGILHERRHIATGLPMQQAQSDMTKSRIRRFVHGLGRRELWNRIVGQREGDRGGTARHLRAADLSRRSKRRALSA